MIIDFIPITLPSEDQPTFKTRVNIDGSSPALGFVDGANSDWLLRLDNSQNLQVLRGGAANV